MKGVEVSKAKYTLWKRHGRRRKGPSTAKLCLVSVEATYVSACGPKTVALSLGVVHDRLV